MPDGVKSKVLDASLFTNSPHELLAADKGFSIVFPLTWMPVQAQKKVGVVLDRPVFQPPPQGFNRFLLCDTASGCDRLNNPAQWLAEELKHLMLQLKYAAMGVEASKLAVNGMAKRFEAAKLIQTADILRNYVRHCP